MISIVLLYYMKIYQFLQLSRGVQNENPIFGWDETSGSLKVVILDLKNRI